MHMVEQQKRAGRRAYRMGRRQESVAETRQRIAAATFELHSEIGPAQTTISAVADRAGVQRHTVYKHFPDLNSLFQACTAHGLEVWGVPNGDSWRAIADPAERFRQGLTEIYRIYRANARSIGMILRDMPIFADVGGDEQYHDRMAGMFMALAEGWAEPPDGALRAAAIRHAMQFDTWLSLTEAGLTDHQARDLMIDLVTRAGRSEP
jgi:AcrR family transcriptional regulator